MTAAAPITPAQRLADTIVEELDLEPPVPIKDLVADVADIKLARLRETGLDAVLHGLHSNRRPTLLIDRDSPPTRQMFTLAHEYGHLSMAWHEGTLSCSIDTADVQEGEHGATQLFTFERDADQFAARLLIPKRFVDSLDPTQPGSMIRAIETTDVSAEAAIYGLASYLKPGYTFVLLDSYGVGPRAVARSAGTLQLGIVAGKALDEEFLNQFFSDSGHEKYAGSHIFWGRHAETMDLVTDSPDWRPILTEIMIDYGYDPTPSGDDWRSVNGVAAWMHGRVGHDNVELLAVGIKQSFLRNADHQALTKHPRFDEFASSRALGFASKK